MGAVTLAITRPITDFREVGRARLRVTVAGTPHDVYDVDLLRAADYFDVAARLEAALNDAALGVTFTVTFGAGCLVFVSSSGSLAVSGSVRRDDEDQHVVAFLQVADLALHPATHGFTAAILAGDWSVPAGIVSGLIDDGVKHFYLDRVCGCHAAGDDPTVGYYPGTHAPITVSPMGPRQLEDVSAAAVASFVASWGPVVADAQAIGGSVIGYVAPPELGWTPATSWTEWVQELLDSGMAIGSDTHGEIDQTYGGTPAPFFADEVAEAGAELLLEPMGHTDLAGLEPWQDGRFGSAANAARCELAVQASSTYFLAPSTRRRLVLLNELATSGEQRSAAPVWLKRGFQAAMQLHYGHTPEQIEGLLDLSWDTDLCNEAFLAAPLPAVVPAVRLLPFTQDAEPTILDGGTAGVPGAADGLALLVPSAEPLSVGPPPLVPALVTSLSTGYPVVPRPCVSGQRGTLITEPGIRPRFRVRWKGKTFEERELVRAFLRDQVQNRVHAFDLEVDGPGTGVRPVRPVADFTDTWEGKPSWVIEVDVEEVFS